MAPPTSLLRTTSCRCWVEMGRGPPKLDGCQLISVGSPCIFDGRLQHLGIGVGLAQRCFSHSSVTLYASWPPRRRVGGQSRGLRQLRPTLRSQKGVGFKGVLGCKRPTGSPRAPTPTSIGLQPVSRAASGVFVWALGSYGALPGFPTAPPIPPDLLSPLPSPLRRRRARKIFRCWVFSYGCWVVHSLWALG